MTLQPAYVATALKELDAVLETLKNQRGVAGGQLRSDVQRRWIVERGLEVACGLLFDLLNHLLASELAAYPETYEDSLRQAGERGVLSPATYAGLRGLGHFRNILAHGYVRIDHDKVAANLNAVLEVFPEAMREIRAWADARAV